MLDDDDPRADSTADHEITDLNLDEVATPQLAVDGEVEHSPISQSAVLVESKSTAQTCCGFSARFALSFLPAFRRRRLAPGSNSDCPIDFLPRPVWPNEEWVAEGGDRSGRRQKQYDAIRRQESTLSGRSDWQCATFVASRSHVTVPMETPSAASLGSRASNGKGGTPA